MNTLVIPDLHLPFTRRDFLDFCRDTSKQYGCKRTVFIGDLVDHHAMSYHEHDPEGFSAGDEYNKAARRLKAWYKAFPVADWCIGNHDELIARKAKTAGIPKRFIRRLDEIYSTPDRWKIGFTFNYGSWLAQHGTNTSGDDGAFKSMLNQGISLVQGHIHTASGVKYHANEDRLLWAMQLGWGADRRSYAFAYGKDFKRKPIINCGVVLNNGTLPIVIPMPL